MNILVIFTIILRWNLAISEDPASNQINNVNPDGSFQFGYQNNDRGSHYHQSSGNAANKVRGRYGSRNAATGRVDETVYTAGPRGFRARGPNIHRKQNLSQVPRAPIGSPTDPLADPHDDPSYGFGFKTKTHSRREESDSSGRVQGQFIYVDDIGEKHGVKYKAGANTGFEVENGVPDSPSNIRYNTPLYKTEPTARGRITFERGPDRQYKFLTSSPDQRRAESTGPDGITRGSYSYLDDKGVQRTVQYIAGAGIGYKVVQSTVGPGTHVSANADNPEYSVKAVSNEIAVSENHNEDDYPTGPSGPSGPDYDSRPEVSYSSTTPYPPNSPFSTDGPYSTTGPSTVRPLPTHPSLYPTTTPFPSPRPFAVRNDPVFVTTPSTIGNHYPPASPIQNLPSGGPSPLSPSGPSGSGENDLIYGLLPPKEEENFYVPPSPTPGVVHITPASPQHFSPSTFRPTPTYLPTAEAQSPYSHNNYQHPSHPTHSPIHNYGPTHNSIEAFGPTHSPVQAFGPTHAPAHAFGPTHGPVQAFGPTQGPLQAYGPTHAPVQAFGPTQHPPPPEYYSPVIKNTSNGWFYGVPPGSALRAHIQNIDLVPTHDRALSPSEALRLDEERDAHHRRLSHPRV